MMYSTYLQLSIKCGFRKMDIFMVKVWGPDFVWSKWYVILFELSYTVIQENNVIRTLWMV